jgi:prophage regulatory protein
MSNAEIRNRHGIIPRLLRRERAASYLDISPGAFDKLVKEKKLPPPKVNHGFKEWDRLDLDAHVDALPYDGAASPDSSWDD